MNDFLKSNGILLGAAALAVVGAVVYFGFFGGASGSGSLLTSPDEGSSPVSNELLQRLSSLHTIKLDNTIFTNPVYISLISFRVVIPPQPIGRSNPFAPIGNN
jgi:quinol-cytochrome oxidoreductase complex cytochrome b subunit